MRSDKPPAPRRGARKLARRALGSTFYSLHYHVVFSTKKRCYIRAEIAVLKSRSSNVWFWHPFRVHCSLSGDPGVSRCSTPGYYLASLRDAEGGCVRVPGVSRRSTPGYCLASLRDAANTDVRFIVPRHRANAVKAMAGRPLSTLCPGARSAERRCRQMAPGQWRSRHGCLPCAGACCAARCGRGQSRFQAPPVHGRRLRFQE
jgi:hypothetical protein